MKILTITAAALVLTACATKGTDGVVEIAPNHYMVGGLGGTFEHSGSAVKVKFFKEAAQYCANKGMTMAPISSTSQDATMRTDSSAEVQFRCVPNK